jgi:hypothetical protein
MPEQRLMHATGFEIKGHLLEFNGYCRHPGHGNKQQEGSSLGEYEYEGIYFH